MTHHDDRHIPLELREPSRNLTHGHVECARHRCDLELYVLANVEQYDNGAVRMVRPTLDELRGTQLGNGHLRARMPAKERKVPDAARCAAESAPSRKGLRS